jgi:tRNA modification GTPase
VDTAGIRKTDDVVENIGVQKAKKYAADADLIIYVVDSTRKLDENDFEIMSLIKNKKVLVLLNKMDLDVVVSKEDINSNLPEAKVVSISAKQELGIDKLEDEIKDMFFSGKIQVNDEIYITSTRHKQLLAEALQSLKLVKQGIDNCVSEDFLTIDFMTAYEKLGLIVGEEVEDDLANRIFERFCMGK